MSFIQRAVKFMELATQLHESGIKKKEIAQSLELYPSVYSSLVNNILKKVSELPDTAPSEATNEAISAIFAQSNNISEQKIRRNIEHYLAILAQLTDNYQQPHPPADKEKTTFIHQLIRQSPDHVLSQLIGLYECYYVSTTGYQVKNEPFRIRRNGAGSLVAEKGNARSVSEYDGFLYVSPNNVLTVHLYERKTISPDNFIIHFQVPPYPKTFLLMKGISTSLSNSYTPVARKLILRKMADSVSDDAYHTIPTVYYDYDPDAPNSLIVKYLYATNALMEFIPVPRPLFNESDLIRELELERTLVTALP